MADYVFSLKALHKPNNANNLWKYKSWKRLSEVSRKVDITVPECRYLKKNWNVKGPSVISGSRCPLLRVSNIYTVLLHGQAKSRRGSLPTSRGTTNGARLGKQGQLDQWSRRIKAGSVLSTYGTLAKPPRRDVLLLRQAALYKLGPRTVWKGLLVSALRKIQSHQAHTHTHACARTQRLYRIKFLRKSWGFH